MAPTEWKFDQPIEQKAPDEGMPTPPSENPFKESFFKAVLDFKHNAKECMAWGFLSTALFMLPLEDPSNQSSWAIFAMGFSWFVSVLANGLLVDRTRGNFARPIMPRIQTFFTQHFPNLLSTEAFLILMVVFGFSVLGSLVLPLATTLAGGSKYASMFAMAALAIFALAALVRLSLFRQMVIFNRLRGFKAILQSWHFSAWRADRPWQKQAFTHLLWIHLVQALAFGLEILPMFLEKIRAEAQDLPAQTLDPMLQVTNYDHPPIWPLKLLLWAAIAFFLSVHHLWMTRYFQSQPISRSTTAN